jgi:hypothetical protein
MTKIYIREQICTCVNLPENLLTCVKVNMLSVHMIFFISTHLMVKHGHFRSLSMPKKEIVSILCGSGFGHWTGS